MIQKKPCRIRRNMVCCLWLNSSIPADNRWRGCHEDLETNPEKSAVSSEYTYQGGGLELDVSKEYTFYMMPVVYTLAPGHHLELRLMTWDPFRVFLDESFDLDASLETRLSTYNYSVTIDNTSLKVLIPVAEAQP